MARPAEWALREWAPPAGRRFTNAQGGEAGRAVVAPDDRTRPLRVSNLVSLRLRSSSLERVALAHAARVETGAEPPHALGRRAVSERLRRDMAARRALERIVADGRRRLEAGLHVARVEQIPLLREMSPHSGQAIGLELHEDRQGIAPRFGRARALLRQLLRDAELVLHVVADLVRDHVGARELPRRPESAGQLLEERAVEVDVGVSGAIERPHRGAGPAAGRINGPAKEHELGGPVLASTALEEPVPCVLGVAQHTANEFLRLVALAGRGAGRRRRDLS